GFSVHLNVQFKFYNLPNTKINNKLKMPCYPIFHSHAIMKKKKEVPREQDFPCRAVKDGGRY
ncbi:hypothetical protein ABDA31_11995, partial [Levilactobacillus brevis]